MLIAGISLLLLLFGTFIEVVFETMKKIVGNIIFTL